MKMTKDMSNLEVAELLRAVSASYELIDPNKNKFRIIAYERAADAIEHLSSEAKDIWDEGKLTDIPGVGTSIAQHLDEIFRTGKSKHFEEIMKGFPPVLFDLMELPRIGAKTAFKLVTQLGIKSFADLEKAAKKGKIALLPGFGEESQSEVLKAMEDSKNRVRRFLLPYAEEIADEIVAWLKQSKAVVKVDPLGSLRRKASTVGDIDISVSSDKPHEVIDRFSRYPKAKRVLEKGEKTASILLPNEVQVDLMVQSPKSYGSLLQHFTGSKHHNIALREYALKKGFSLSEYGIKNTRSKNPLIKKFPGEEDFYNYLGLKWIPPELREDMGEIEASLEDRLPFLVEQKDIKSDLHIHSSFDIETSHDLGESTMEEIIEKANSLGYEYIAFAEHNPSRSKHKETEVIDIIKSKKETVDKLNYSLLRSVKSSVKKVFNSLEIDILPDGNLAIPEKAFNFLDFALISIHSSFNLGRNQMTERVLKGLSHPKVKIFAHPTGRRLNFREGVELDWPKIFEYCKKNSKWIEINADPVRLDLPDTLVKEAIQYGVKLTLGTDAHHKDGLDNMKWGVSVARRGWAEKENIVNTYGLIEFEKMLK